MPLPLPAAREPLRRPGTPWMHAPQNLTDQSKVAAIARCGRSREQGGETASEGGREAAAGGRSGTGGRRQCGQSQWGRAASWPTSSSGAEYAATPRRRLRGATRHPTRRGSLRPRRWQRTPGAPCGGRAVAAAATAPAGPPSDHHHRHVAASGGGLARPSAGRVSPAAPRRQRRGPKKEAAETGGRVVAGAPPTLRPPAAQSAGLGQRGRRVGRRGSAP